MKPENQPYTILLVDDEPGIRKVLEITLTHAGFTVWPAPDGDAGWRLFRERHPDIVITDIKMPGIDGIDLLKRIKQTRPETEVIMITGHGDMDLAVKSLQHEAADFITKPIDDAEIESAVKKAVDRISINHRIHSYMADLELLLQQKDRAIDESKTLSTIGQTSAGMSHVIKNIAGGLKGSSFILEQGIENENREYLVKGWEMMKKNIDKITNLSLDLLNYAKTARLELKPAHPDEPVREISALLEHQAAQAGIDLSVSFLGKADLQIRMDVNAIHTCLLNLVTNALDAFDASQETEGSRQVRVSVLKKKDRIVYQVEDNGAGMNQTAQKAVFNEFFTTKGTRGTGFGLMTTKKIVEEHQGEIGFTTREAEGSTFWISLPLLSKNS
ncbi:MAG TPA: response regulator [Desulfotignum sp.]|nr:response regulator [Desulfotignum sp.]